MILGHHATYTSMMIPSFVLIVFPFLPNVIAAAESSNLKFDNNNDNNLSVKKSVEASKEDESFVYSDGVKQLDAIIFRYKTKNLTETQEEDFLKTIFKWLDENDRIIADSSATESPAGNEQESLTDEYFYEATTERPDPRGGSRELHYCPFGYLPRHMMKRSWKLRVSCDDMVKRMTNPKRKRLARKFWWRLYERHCCVEISNSEDSDGYYG